MDRNTLADKNLIKILKNIAVLLEIKGENPFKARAYSNAATIIAENDLDIEQLVKDKKLGEISGFGEALQRKLTEYVETGTIGYYDNLIEDYPLSLVSMTKIAGLGVKKVKLLCDGHGIKTLEQLEKACLDNVISGIKGFTATTQENILNSLDHLKNSAGRYLQEEAMHSVNELYDLLCSMDGVTQCSFTGETRRFSEVIEKFSLIVGTDAKEKLIEKLLGTLNCTHSDGLILTSTEQGIPIEIEIVDNDRFVMRLHESTGSKEYVEEFNKLLSGNTRITVVKEEELYSSYGLQYVPAELRESSLAIEKAKNQEIPKLIEDRDLKGMLHVHSVWSDGRNTIREMALKAKEFGFSYIAMCDHSRSAGYAGGLSIERVRQQHDEIDQLNNEGLGIRIIKGIESDILADGSLDYPDDVLDCFELVVASVHSNFKMSKEQMTKRIVYALMSNYTTILGHPTGRLLLTRPAYEIDIRQVIDAAFDYGKVIEINANPYRLDLSWENVIYAREKGMKIAINPDSHRTDTLKDIYMGVKVARKGWLTSDDVINCLEYDQFKKLYCRK